MEFLPDIIYNMYYTSSLFVVIGVGRGYVLATSNPSKERDNWKGKYKAKEHKCFTFQKEVAELKERAKHVDSLQRR